MTGNHGEYEFIFETKPNKGDEELFNLIALAYDVRGRSGFVIIARVRIYEQTGFIKQAFELGNGPGLVFIETILIKGNHFNSDEYYAALKVTIPEGIYVRTLDVKNKIEDNF